MFKPRVSRPAFELLVDYARHHRDQRNIATHLVGVPLVVLAASILLSRSAIELGSVRTTPAWIALAGLSLWTLSKGQWLLGLATTLFAAALVWAAHGLAGAQFTTWLVLALGCLIVGWAFQFVGHYYEGRAPALADDIASTLVAPMFVVMELLALAGLCRGLQARVAQAAGPTVLRDLAQPLAR